jgi:S-adenosylmethionine-dependent methyltransferase
MTTRAKSFAAGKENYLNYIMDPRGQIFHQMVQMQVAQHLPQKAVHVLDIGCAFGVLDLWLAKIGHHVTGLDLTPEYLELARQRAEEEHVMIDYQLFNVDEAELTTLGKPFELVLCHNVLEYVRSADDALAKIAATTASGGLLSLINHNPDGKVLQAAIFEKDPVLALKKLDQTSEFIHLVQDECSIFTPTELKAKLEAVGFDVIAHYGVRTLYDLIDPAKRQEDIFNEDMLKLETTLAARSPFRDIAVFTHLIARKR